MLLDAMVVNGKLTRRYDPTGDTFIYNKTNHIDDTWSGYGCKIRGKEVVQNVGEEVIHQEVHI